MPHYFRVQPAGLSLSHRSETSVGEVADGLHVFEYLHQVRFCDGQGTAAYGDEVVLLSAPRDWPNGDVEGVCVDGVVAQVVRRFTVADFAAETEDMDGDLTADEVSAALAG